MPSAPGTAPAAAGAAGADGTTPSRLSELYKWAVTPVIFVSFLVSLAWVDFKYYTIRLHNHEDSHHGHGRMPAFLHRLIFRPQPYQYVRVQQVSSSSAAVAPGNGRAQQQPRTRADDGSARGWYYHAHQRKLMRMEVADAFRIRGTVLAVLVGIAAAFAWLIWQGLRWSLRRLAVMGVM